MVPEARRSNVTSWSQRAVAALTATTVLLLAACGAPDDEAQDPGKSGLELAIDDALIPPESIDGHGLRTLDLHPKPIMRGIGGSDTTVVTRIDGDVVAVTSSPIEEVNRSRGAPYTEDGVAGPEVDGAPTRLLEGWGLLRRSLLVPVHEELVQVASRTASVAELGAAAAEVVLPVDGEGAVPGELVGILHADPDRPVAFASYESGEEMVRYPMAVFVAAAAEQAAYLALAHLDPGQSIDLQTEASCCADEIMRPARSVTVRGIESTIATLSTSRKVLVVPGDPGIVVVTDGVRSWDDTIPTDDQMIAVAEGSRVASQEELVGHVRARDDAALHRQLREIRASEIALGWKPLAELIHAEHPIVLSTGSARRPEDLPDLQREQQVCAVYLSEHVSTGSPIAACVPTTAPTSPLVIASAMDGGMPVQAGAVTDDVARVVLEYPEGSIEAKIIDVPASKGVSVRRLFVLVGTIDQQIGLSGDDLVAAMRAAAFVAYDGGGRELLRLPRFPHLQG